MEDATRNKVEDYPAGRLPEDVRGQIDPTAVVTVDVSVKSATCPTFRDIFAALHASRVMSDDPVLRIRALREEWDDRERFLENVRRGGSA